MQQLPSLHRCLYMWFYHTQSSCPTNLCHVRLFEFHLPLYCNIALTRSLSIIPLSPYFLILCFFLFALPLQLPVTRIQRSCRARQSSSNQPVRACAASNPFLCMALSHSLCSPRQWSSPKSDSLHSRGGMHQFVFVKLPFER